MAGRRHIFRVPSGSHFSHEFSLESKRLRFRYRSPSRSLARRPVALYVGDLGTPFYSAGGRLRRPADHFILWLNGGLEMGFRCLSTWMTGQTIEAMPRSCYKFACLLAGARRRVKLSETLTVCDCRTQPHRYRGYAEGLFAAYSQSAFACLPRVPLTQTVVPPWRRPILWNRRAPQSPSRTGQQFVL